MYVLYILKKIFGLFILVKFPDHIYILFILENLSGPFILVKFSDQIYTVKSGEFIRSIYTS